MKSFLRAINFLTVIPFDKNLSMERKEVAESSLYFPLVGALMGLLLVVIDFLFGSFFPEHILNLFVIISLIALSGSLHLDGFIDAADGFFSGKSRERILEIMKDSRVGAFGVISVFCLLLLKLSFLNEIQPEMRYAVLILMPTISRWTIVFNAFKYPYARKTSGAGEPFARLVGKKELTGATILTFLLTFFLLRIQGLAVWLAVFMTVFLIGRWINEKIGGMTGDVYGALVEVSEVAFLIFIYLINSI